MRTEPRAYAVRPQHGARMKIRTHLFLLALGAIAPLLAMAIIAGTLLVQHERKNFESEALGRVRAAMSGVDAELRGSITTLQALAASQNLESGDIRAFNEEARRVLASQQPYWRNIGLATVSRVPLINAVRPYEAQPAFGADDKSFDDAIRTRRPVIGPVMAGPLVSDPSVRIRMPVVVAGAVRYVLSVPLDPASFDKLLRAQRLPEGWVIGLADREKRFIARLPGVAVGTPISTSFAAAVARAPEGWFWGRTLEGASTYSPYVTSSFSGWVLGIAIPASLVDAGAWRTFWMMAAGVLSALALALALAGLIARRIAKPIILLADAAQDLGPKLDSPLPTGQAIEEIEKLHAALREASQTIRERQVLLENERSAFRAQAELLDLTHDAILVRTTDGVITFWSKGAEEMYGWRSSEALGQVYHQLLRTDFAGRRGEIETELERLDRWEGALCHTSKAGATLVVASRWVLRREPSGKADFVLEINSDITRRTLAEEAIVKLNQDLIESGKRKDEFLATLAHELRNPLAPIKNCVAVLKAVDLPEHKRVWAREVIERQVGLMARLLDDLLDIGRITHGKLELRRERLTLAAVVESAIEISRPAIVAGSHALIVAPHPHVIALDADPVRLAQIISNLLTNAAKYSNPSGRIWLTTAQHGNAVSVHVKDEGIGISANMLARVFELFAQEDVALNRAQGGMGIGLALVRALTELHGGTVEAHSGGPHKGSEFIVRLPAAAAALPVPESPGAGLAVDKIPRTTILIADDLTDSAESLAMLLRQLGHDVHTAYDGEQAFEAAARIRPHVALFDIGMPKLNGYQLAGKIREQPWGSGMVLIALSGWGHEDDRRRSQQAGFAHHLVKPVDFDELLAVLQSVLAERSTLG